MADNSKNSKRIAQNTLVLYFRMLFLMLVSLYTGRVILDALGVEDYGIYNVVGGFVSMFALISAALTSACSRFLNFEMDNSNLVRQNVVFSTAVTIHWSLAIIIFLLAECVGLWYVNYIMVLPTERLTAANCCFQLSILIFCMNLIMVPYYASIIAHERMKTFAYISIYEGLAKLGISFLVFLNPFDRLVFYSLMLCIVQFSVQYYYHYYCRKNFEECIYRKVLDRPLLKQMLSYSAWHFVGNGAAILKSHGVNIVLNLFFGPKVNAARGIATQIEHAVNQLAGNFMMAINPQITQSYAKGDLNYMFKLIEKGAKFSFYMLWLISLPIIINTNYILEIWLKEVPEYTATFVRLSLICMLISTLSRPLITAQNATGIVRNYQLIVGGIILLNLPLSYLALSLGANATSVVIIAMFTEVIALAARMWMIPMTIHDFKPFVFVKDIVGRCVIVAITSIVIPYIINYNMERGLLSFLVTSMACIFATSIAILKIGCDESDKKLIYSKCISAKNKILHK